MLNVLDFLNGLSEDELDELLEVLNKWSKEVPHD